MKTKTWSKKNICSGIIAGLIGGVAIGFIMIRMHMMAGVGSMFGMPNPLAGYIVHLILCGILGLIFALIFNSISNKFFQCTIWGVIYGICWWILGSLIIAPLMMGMTVSMGSDRMGHAIPMLVGDLVFGLVLGVCYYWMKSRK